MANGKTFEQTLAETGRQSTLDELRRTGQFDAAKSAFEAGGGPFRVSGSFSGPSAGAPDFESTVRRSLELQKEATAPAVQSLQASVPETRAAFQTRREQLEAKRSPLQTRFDNLMSDIKGRQTQEETAATRVTSRELGRRGITGSSGVAERELAGAVSPIRERFAGLARDIGLGREEALQGLEEQITGLVPAETQAVRAITNAIAQLQAGGAQAGIQTALDRMRLAQQQSQFDVTQGAQSKQDELARRIFEEVTLPESAATIANIKSLIAERGRGAGGGDELAALGAIFGGTGGMGGLGGILGLGNLSIGRNVEQLFEQGDLAGALQLALNP